MFRSIPLLLLVIGCGSSVRLGDEDALGGTGGTDVGGAPTGGSATVCQPGEERPCYEGPVGTEEQGLCRPGVERCASDGSGFGACEDEILPTEEHCTDELDHDCDGFSGCLPAVAWAQRFGSTGDQTVADLAVDSSGLVFAGCMEGSTSFGADPITSAGKRDGFVARLALFGSDIYSRRFGGPGRDCVSAVATDPNDDALVLGRLEGTVDLGDGPEFGDNDFFALRLDENGETTAAKRWTSPGEELGWLRASSGPLHAIGGFHHTALPLGPSPILPQGGSSLVAASLTEDLTADWVTVPESGSIHGLLDIVEADGALVVGGWFADALTLGGTQSATGGPHGLVAVLDGQGLPQWLRGLEGPGVRVTGVAVRDGTIGLVGRQEGELDYGGQSVRFAAPGIFVAFLPLIDPGSTLAVAPLTGGGDAGEPKITAGPGGFTIGGSFSAPLLHDGDPILENATSWDAFVVAVDGEGGLRWAARFGDQAEAFITGLAHGPDGELYVAGNYRDGPLDIAEQTLPNEGDHDIFVARFDPPR